MEGEYTLEWSELRRLSRRMLRVAGTGVALLLAVPLSAYVPHSAAKIIGLALLVGWVGVLLRYFFLSYEYVYWSCPRCGEPFHYRTKWYGRWNNPFAQRCVHCGLPKWVDSDPDPKLKRELDPFRSDSTFKLGQ
jgi:predicted RNA-binding Zn-ribbon protein involved in translation (DUF1610 family)